MSIFSHNSFYFFFFNDTATTEIYTLSLHDALPILELPGIAHLAHQVQIQVGDQQLFLRVAGFLGAGARIAHILDRKSTRLNSSHGYISYAVFCLKKKQVLAGIVLL